VKDKIRVSKEKDFIGIKKFDYSLAKLKERYPNGCPPSIQAKALMMSDKQVQVLWDKLLGKLRKKVLTDSEIKEIKS